jgi:hypothetical protein
LLKSLGKGASLRFWSSGRNECCGRPGSICVLRFKPVKQGRAFLLVPLSLLSIEPLIFRKQTTDSAADLDGSGDKCREPEVATGH